MQSKQAAALRAKIESGDVTFAVIGQGYVGLPLAMEVAGSGMRCIGVDISKERVERANRGESYIIDIPDEQLKRAVDQKLYRATTDYSEVAEADAISICVPTPLRKTRDPDVSYIQSALSQMREHIKAPCLIVLESTTYPGTTEEVVVEMLKEVGLKLDEDVFVAFSPERVDPGNATYQLKNTPKVIGGVTAASTELAVALYGKFVDHVHPVGSASEAEMVKLLENTFRAVNIALVNEMMLMCDRMGIDIWNVIEAAGTKPFGFMKFTPGPGIGGHCIPLDPTYLSWKAKSYGFYNRFIELATDINGNMPRFVVQKLTRALNDHASKPLKGSRVMLVGMSYKPDIDDLRESPALDLWGLLKQWGAELSYHDEFVPEIASLQASSQPLDEATLRGVDAVVIATAHKQVDYAKILANAPLVLDTRGVYKQSADHLVSL